MAEKMDDYDFIVPSKDQGNEEIRVKGDKAYIFHEGVQIWKRSIKWVDDEKTKFRLILKKGRRETSWGDDTFQVGQPYAGSIYDMYEEE